MSSIYLFRSFCYLFLYDFFFLCVIDAVQMSLLFESLYMILVSEDAFECKARVLVYMFEPF